MSRLGSVVSLPAIIFVNFTKTRRFCNVIGVVIALGYSLISIYPNAFTRCGNIITMTWQRESKQFGEAIGLEKHSLIICSCGNG